MNTFLIIAVLAAMGLGGAYFYSNAKKAVDAENEDEVEIEGLENKTVDELAISIQEYLSERLRRNLEDEALTQRELKRERETMAELRDSLNNASLGDGAAKTVLINRIKALLSTKNSEFEIRERDIDRIINFDNPPDTHVKFEIILYCYTKAYREKGLSKMINEYRMDEPVLVEDSNMQIPEYVVTEERLDRIYDSVMENQPMTDTDIAGNELELRSSLGDIRLNYDAKIDILTQLIYESRWGFGVVDPLYYQDLDEIDCGVSGRNGNGGVDYDNGAKRAHYRYESVWIMFHGRNIRFAFLRFKNNDELKRVSDNVYRFNSAEPLSEKKGYITGTMPDGSRITVSRPPFSESYAFFLRKFSSAGSSPRPATLIEGKDHMGEPLNHNAFIPLALMKWAIKGERNTMITGGAGTGKSTFLKAMIRYVSPMYNIRVSEMAFELALPDAYPDRNILTMQETPTVDAQQGLNIAKKMNSAVTILGEVATAIQASEFIQTAMVNSRFGLGTHHAGSTRELVEAFSNNLLELGLFSDKKDAVLETAATLDVDCHLAFANGERHIAAITEILTVGDEGYPTLMGDEEPTSNTVANERTLPVDKKMMEDARYYFRRSTSPNLFKTHQLMHWTDEGGNKRFVLDSMPSPEVVKEIQSTLMEKDRIEFDYDMKMLEKAGFPANYEKCTDAEKKEIEQWKQRLYSV